MLVGTFSARFHQVIHPVVFESLRIWIKALRFGNQFDLSVIVWSPSIGCNDCPFEVGVLKVGPRVIHWLLLPSILARLSLAFGNRAIDYGGTCVSDKSSALTLCTTSSNECICLGQADMVVTDDCL